MDSSGPRRGQRARSRSPRTRKATNVARASVGVAANRPIVIRPRKSSAARPSRPSSAASTVSGSNPALAGSRSTLTWSRTGTARPGRTSAATVASRWASSSECTDSITSNSSTARRALFAWSGPMRCHAAPSTSGILAAASWTRFSPSTRKPAATAARMRSAGTVLDTATSVTRVASRPARAAAAPIRPRTSSRARRNASTSAGSRRSAVIRAPGPPCGPVDQRRRRKLGISRSSAS